MSASSDAEEIIHLRDVFKIFGPQPRGRAYELSRAGVPKNDVQRQTGHVVGLTNVNFSVKQGEIFVVMGLSGSGKSTAIRTVNKLHDVTMGEVIVDGVDVQKLSGKAITLDVKEVKKPELCSVLVAEHIAHQLAQRVSFRRAMKKAIQTAMRMGAKGIRIRCGGRLGVHRLAAVLDPGAGHAGDHGRPARHDAGRRRAAPGLRPGPQRANSDSLAPSSMVSAMRL